MSYFDQIYSETVKYRDGFQAISTYLEALKAEKLKQVDLTAYSRRRKFIIKNTLIPLVANLKSLKHDGNAKLESRLEVLKSKAAIKRRKLEDQIKEQRRPIEQIIIELQDFIADLDYAAKIYEDEIDQFDDVWLRLAKKYDLKGVKDSFSGYHSINNLNEILNQRQRTINRLRQRNGELKQIEKDYQKQREIITEDLRTAKKEARKTATSEPVRKKYEPLEIDRLINLAKNIESQLMEEGRKSNELGKISMTLNQEIDELNTAVKSLDLDVALIPRLPEPIDSNILSSLYQNIGSEINKVRSLYPQSKFNDSLRIVSMIRHDVSDDRGYKAFSNRKQDLVRTTNRALEYFNTHTWQVSGKRWERISGHSHGFKSVTPTHTKIKEIS